MHISSILYCLVFPGLALGRPPVKLRTTPSSIGSYDWSPQTVISTPDEPGFFNATARWTIYRPPSFNLEISPATEEDVITAIQYAQANNMSFLATGGRHGYSTSLGALKGGLEIDLSQLNSISIDKAAKTLTIGPGVRFRDIFDPVYEAGFQIQTGSCSCVGMMGATLGGGIGRLLGLNGLIIDALISARLVTASGEVLTVSKTSNPELFWGLKGAGFNFGIVTEATFELHPLYKGGIWTNADLIFTGDKNHTYFETLASLAPLPADLAVETLMNWNATLNETQLVLSVVYAGPMAEGLEAMAPILDLGPSYSHIKEIHWNELSTQSLFALDPEICEDGNIWDIHGVSLRDFSAPTYEAVFETLKEFWAANPGGLNSQVTLESWPNEAAIAIPESSAAYPWRDATTNVLIQFKWDGSDDSLEGPSNVAGKKIRSQLAATSGYDDLAVYVNYAWGDETPAQMYGASNLPRLVALKQKYDPNNFFGFYNALPTSLD